MLANFSQVRAAAARSKHAVKANGPALIRTSATIAYTGRSAQNGGNIAAVDSRDVGGGLQRHGMVQERLGDILGGDLAAEKIARHVPLFVDAAGFGAGGNQLRRQQPAPDAVGVYRVGANAVRSV